MTQQRYFVTTSIPYVNGLPHLGYALEAVQTDVLARYHRLVGDDTYFLTGTDDNALKNVRSAEAAGVATHAFVDQHARRFEQLRGPLSLSFDDFIRTSTDQRHRAGVQKLWRACAAAGDIYQRDYHGLYCIPCELFYAEDELDGDLCPVHHVPVEPVAEKNFFFRLSHYRDQLLERIESGELRIVPDHRHNEVVSFIRRGLEDFSISRSLERARGWGIPVPDNDQQVMYVWFDALGNYITALKYATDGEQFQWYWLDNPNRIHVIGKDILRFHAIYWPAMLLSAGVPLPTTIYVHEFLTVEGQRISKTAGNIIDPVALSNQFGTDALRYWLLREMPRTEDGNFTVARLIDRYNTDLADDLGNLLNRTVSMIHRYRSGVLPHPGPPHPSDHQLVGISEGLPDRLRIALDAFDFRSALAAVWEFVGQANRYVEENTPWLLARHEQGGDERARQHLDRVLYTLADVLRLLSHHLYPFLPRSAEKICWQLGLPATLSGSYDMAVSWGKLQPGIEMPGPSPIFPKIEVTSPHE